MTTASDQRAAVLLAFMQLSEVGPARGRQLVVKTDPLSAWEAIRRGEPTIDGVSRDLEELWRSEAARLDPFVELQRHRAAGVTVTVLGDTAYPEVLAADRQPPPLLVSKGAWPAAVPCCAIVGTRRCSRYGRDVASSLGRDLAASGVSVVSGLALGIDGAAHLGALAGGAPPIGVVACGLDVPYPRRHATLWEQVASAGVLVSEWPLGTAPMRWRFPARNRLIATLATVVVVVESDVSGGSMHTVRQADDRGRTILAVPGPVTSPSSRGTNLLLAEGCGPCRDADDVVVALGLAGGASLPSRGRLRADAAHPEVPRGAHDVLDRLGATRWSLEGLAEATGRSVGDLSVVLVELEGTGAVVCSDGWYEAAR